MLETLPKIVFVDEDLVSLAREQECSFESIISESTVRNFICNKCSKVYKRAGYLKVKVCKGK